MPPQFEDQVDISGDPPPGATPTPRQLSGATRSKVNRTTPPQAGEQRSEAAAQQHAAEGDAAQATPEDSRAPQQDQQPQEGAAQKIGDFLAQQPFSEEEIRKNPFNPIDWGKEIVNEGAHVYHAGQLAYRSWTALMGSVPDSVHNIWNQDSAAGYFLRNVATNPTAFAGNPLPAINQLYGHFSGVKDPERQTQDVLGGVLPQTASPVNVLMPEGKLAFTAAMTTPSVTQALFSNNKEEQINAATWGMASSIILNPAHLSMLKGPMSQALERIAPGLSKFATDKLKVTLDEIGKRNADVQAPGYNPAEDYIKKVLQEGGFPGADRVVHFAKPGTQQATVLPSGEVVIKNADKQLKKLLSRFGVSDVPELVQKINTTGLSESETKFLTDNRSKIPLPYDLRQHTPEDVPLRDPRRQLLNLRDAADAHGEALGNEFLSTTDHLLYHLKTGPWANSANPLQSLWRSMTGTSRLSDYVFQDWQTSMLKLAEHGQVDGTKVMKAIEGDMDTYNALSPHGKMVVDSARLLTNGLRQAARGTAFRDSFVGNFWWRVDKPLPRPRGGRGAVPSFTSEAQPHRSVSLLPGGPVESDGRQAYLATQSAKTVQDTNRMIREDRQGWQAAILDLKRKVPGKWANDPEVQDIRKLAASDPAEAAKRAESYGKMLFREKEEDFFKVLSPALRQMKALQTHHGIDFLTHMQIRVPNPEGEGEVLVPAAFRTTDGRQMQLRRRLGYDTLGGLFNGPDGKSTITVHPEVSKLLNRSITLGSQSRELLGGSRWWNAVLKTESTAVKMIMYSPLIHGWNVLGRAGALGFQHPIEAARLLTQHGPLHPGAKDEAAFALRAEAFRYGVLPHLKFTPAAYEGKIAAALGDAELNDPAHLVEDVTGSNKALSGAARVGKVLGSPFDHMQHKFWQQVNDFGVMAYHLEKQAALHAGASEMDARLWAGRRANSWMGFVAPEDTNPIIHDLSRMVLFAPNWWRSFAELMAPLYKNSGIGGDMSRYMAGQDVKAMLSMLAVQKLSGNAANLLLSGHLQNENQPGNQDRIEITAPWALHALKAASGAPVVGGEAASLLGGVDPNTGVDPLTGGHVTLENPLGRQMRAAETAFGLESGYSDWQPQDMEKGLSTFIASRTSPFLNGLMATGNVDLYRSMKAWQIVHVNPAHDWPQLDNAFYGLAYASPLGPDLAFNIERATAQGQNPNASIFGTEVPKGVQDVLGPMGNSFLRVVFTWLTGVNPPYEYSAKTRGDQPTDQQYRSLAELKTQYTNQQQQLSAEALGGAKTPSQWLQAYQSQSSGHAAAVRALLKDDPSYVNGAEGLAAQYEALYDAPGVALPDGTIDYQKLDALQAQFEQQHSPGEIAAMQGVLNKNQQAIPMVALYHKTIDAYRNWQESWAAQNGVDVGTLRADISTYGQVYNDQRQRDRFLAEHPDVREYERAKEMQFYRTPQGLLWGLFYNSSIAERFLQQGYGGDVREIEQAVQNA